MEALLIPSNTYLDIPESTIISKLISNTKSVRYLSEKLCVCAFSLNNGTQQKYYLFKVIERENITLYVFRKCFESFKEYDIFSKSGATKDPDCFKCETEDIEIEAKLAELKKPETIKISLPDSMIKFERERDFSNKTQSYIFEMEDWIKSTKDIERYPIFKALQRIVIDHKEANIGKGWFYLDIEDMHNHKILFRYNEKVSNTHYYLFKVTDNIDKDISSFEEKLTYNGEILLKSAVRGYPDWIMYDDYQSWSDIEGDKKANLALSDEEVLVLNTAQYPFFINGLAGSGKSTILYYLFANVYASDKQKDKEFIFLSYSKNLTEEAKRIIVSLYCTNPHINNGKRIETTDKEKNDINRMFDKYFKTFQDFIQDKFLDNEEKKLFSKAKHMNYDKFQEHYRKECHLPKKTQYSPIVVWSVIRTFIKGRKYDQYITSNQYAQIERDDRTVTIDDFKIIEEIFNRWYKNYSETREYWDDLDLIRYVLNNKKITPEYDIIFCDEAQDFTPIENRLILSMSKYSKYDLSDFKQIPIAYAGDPNQTISPTGFKWERMKDIFNKSFKEQIGDYMSLDIQTLNNNYRSKKAIVQFANSLQYIRKCFLTKDKLVPQSLWNPIGNVSPLFYYEEEIEDILVEGLNKAASIITGDDDEEIYKNDKDSILLQVSNQEKIHTAITAKGLEADAVIIYKFADKMPDSFSKIFKSQEVALESEKYECMHFLTKLYIAVSRAKKILYIIDTKPNYDKLWQHFIDNEFINHKLLPSRSKDIEVWDKKDENDDIPMGGIMVGKKDEFIQKLEENYKPEEIAEDIFNKAIINEDAREMKRAAGYFEEASNIARAKECLAYYHLFRQEYEIAGDLFSNPIVSKNNKAAEAYWEGKCWIKIAKSEDLIKRAAAQYYLKEKSLIDLLKIKDFAQNFDILSDTYNDIAHRISEDAEKFENKNLFFKLTEFLEELSKRGFKFLKENLAMLYYKNEEYQNAVTVWEDINLTASKPYYDAKEHLTNDNDYNEKIFWMYKGGKIEEIFKKYSNINITNKLNHESIRIVFMTLLNQKGQFEYALNYPYNGKDKYDLLYNTNPLLFIDKFVLDDYKESNFIDYIENKVKDNNNRIFDKPLSINFIEKIFKLGNDYTGEKPIWINFLKLRDKSGNRVFFKNAQNFNTIFEVLINYMRTNNTIHTASCFMEMLFGINYSYQRALKYYKTTLSVFDGKNYFVSKQDFNIAYTRNTYFTQCEFDNTKLSIIKNNLSYFATETLKNKPDLELYEAKLLYRIIEKTAKYADIDNLYRQQLKTSPTTPIYDYCTIRLAINILYSINKYAFSDFKNAYIVKQSIQTVVDTFDRDDSTAFIRKAVVNPHILTSDYIRIIAELLYKDKEFVIADIETNDNTISVLDRIISKEIYTMLSSRNADTYLLKILYFAYEKIYSNDSTIIAEKYDKIIKNNNLKEYPEVLTFIKERALYRWKWINPGIAEAKMVEYDYIYPIDNIESYPNIKNETEDYDNNNEIKETIYITANQEINKIQIVLNKKKKRVQFRQDSDDIFEIENGEIEIEDEDLAQQNDQTVTISDDFVVTVESATVINIVSHKKKYVVDFDKLG